MADKTTSSTLEKLKRQGEELEKLIESSLDLEDEEFFRKITTLLETLMNDMKAGKLMSQKNIIMAGQGVRLWTKAYWEHKRENTPAPSRTWTKDMRKSYGRVPKTPETSGASHPQVEGSGQSQPQGNVWRTVGGTAPAPIPALFSSAPAPALSGPAPVPIRSGDTTVPPLPSRQAPVPATSGPLPSGSAQNPGGDAMDIDSDHEAAPLQLTCTQSSSERLQN